MCLSLSTTLSDDVFNTGDLVLGWVVRAGIRLGELHVGFLSVYAPTCP